jgi:hypothetical protein
VVELTQLVALGMTESGVRKRVAAGRLHRVFRGVYAVGHRRLTKHGLWMAAVLASGDGAVLSHLSAGELLNLRRSGNIIHVTSPTRSRKGLKGIRLHQPRVLLPEHVTTVDGIPVTSVPRVLADLAGTLDKQQLKRVWQEAQRQGLLDVNAVKPLARQPRRGIAKLNALIDDAEDVPDTKSEFEHRFHDFITDRPDIPRPAYNVALHGYVVDAAWLSQGLVYVTWKALTRTPETVAARLRILLAAPSDRVAASAHRSHPSAI